jgi:prepilin-type N-terminal cleavage/methylation domain-containing protein
MSIAEPRTPRSAGRQARGPARPRASRRRGFTFIEIAVSMIIIGLTTLAIDRTVAGLTGIERTLRAIRNTSERCQRAAYRLRDLVSSARKLYQNDAIGPGYLSRLAIPTSAPMLAGSRLPKFDETHSLGPDLVGDPRSGNLLLLVRELDPLPCVSDPATKKIRAIDAYRFVCVYLTTSTKTLVTGGGPALDLVEWRSESFPSYAQVMAIPAGIERTRVVQELYTRYGADTLWDMTKDVMTAFYSIDGAGTVSATPTPPTKIPEDLNVSTRGRFVPGNLAVPRTDVTSWPRKPLFTVESPAVWSPHCFEVKIAGPSGSRRVWIRLTVEQQASQGQVPAYEATVVANTRDA